MTSTRNDVLPADRLERVEGWGMSAASLSYVYRPTNIEGICAAFAVSRETGRPVALRGAGRSYGDAALNSEGIVLDLSRMNRILEWNPQTGIMACEPGVTIQQVWQHAIEDGWWPPVVPGTMFPTLGGAAAMNIHGKNNWKAGPIGEHILSFDLLLPTGQIKTCTPADNSELFYSAISGFGMLGVFTRLTVQLKKVYSGLLDIHAYPVANLDDLFAKFERDLPHADYLVGWIDCFASGAALGRGQVHRADYLKSGDDPRPAQSLRVENQELPDTLLGIVPKSLMWRMMKPFVNNPGVRLTNAAKYFASARQEAKYRQSHAGFAFLLDYVPNWKYAYKPGRPHTISIVCAD